MTATDLSPMRWLSTNDAHAERQASKSLINAACPAAGVETVSITLGARYKTLKTASMCLTWDKRHVMPHGVQNTSPSRDAAPSDCQERGLHGS